MASLIEGGLGTPEVIGIAALALGILRLAELLINKAFNAKRNGHEATDKAGDKTVSEWEQRIERVVERVVQNKVDFRLSQIQEGIHDLKAAVQTLIRWKGGD